MNREEIIKGVKGCVGMYYGFRCGKCPYGPYSSDCVESLHRDVEWLMEAETPRVLTMSEIPEHDGAVFIEYVDDAGEWAVYVPEGAPYFAFMTSKGGRWMSPGDYERTWRAWTGRPTPKQRWQK